MARLLLERALEKAAPLLVALADDTAGTIGNEEVHDLRVALRRLRSWLRAARDLLQDDISRRELAALRRLARHAGAARDAQVQWHWLTAPGEPFSAPAARAAHRLAAARHAEYGAARERLQRRAADRWPALATSLAAALAPQVDGAAPPPNTVPGESLAEHLAPVLARHLASARSALDDIEHRTQVAAIHRARIQVKRLRYLVEAVGAPSRHVTSAVRHLRALQDTLGDLHDAHVMERQVAPLLVRDRRRDGRVAGRPALRDLRALRAVLHRRELAAFRHSLDLAAGSAAALWRAPAAVARTLLRGPPAAQVATRPADAPRAIVPPNHAPPDRRG